MKNRLIAVDDDIIIIELINAALGKQNFDVVGVTSAKAALNLFLEEPTHVIISDLNMPEMNGAEFMSKIFETGHNPVFIMLTAETDVKKVVELFKQGIHDYIIKPFNSAELISRVTKAFEFAELRIMQENIQKEREIRIEHQLNWNLFKENMIKKDSDKIDSGLMTNINTSLIQGAGLGTLNPLVDLIKSTSQLEGNHYLVEKDLMEMLFENTKFSNNLIKVIGDIDHVINTDLPKQNMSISGFYQIIEDAVKEAFEYQKVRNNTIVLAKNNHASNTRTLNINPDFFKKAALELLFNAFKFSDEGSKIYILFEILKDSFQVSFLNAPDSKTNEHKGIGPEYQSIIFEPFFRISRFVFESYPTLDFGLGLCYVEKIVRNHRGSIRVINLKNYLENNNKFLVDFAVEIPFAS